MKRFQFSSRVTINKYPDRFEREAIVESVMTEQPAGDWVRWSDVEKLREELESKIPEKRIERLERMIGMVHDGKCPECHQKTRDYKAPSGSFAPEAFSTLREAGVDPATGHRLGCSIPKFTA